MHLSLFAPAKVNLDLAITGTRADGYHTLRSHVAFADCGDVIEMNVEQADAFSCALTLDGPFAHQIANEDPARNLVVRAAKAFCEAFNHPLKIELVLHKNLPCGSGLGGGSSDAAATLRGLCHATETSAEALSDTFLTRIGADVPVCFHAHPCLMEGIGENLSPWTFEDTDAVLVWPGPGGSTQALYAAWDANPASTDDGNDFQRLAAGFQSGVDTALQALSALPGCHKAALSGSGTAVFGLFDTPPDVTGLAFPWVQPCKIGFVKKPLVTIRR